MTKYDFTDSPQPEKQEEVEEVKRATVEEMIEVGRRLGVGCILTGQMDPILQQAAQAQAEAQARLDQLGHHTWEARSRKLFAELPHATNLREAVAETAYQASGAVKSLLECWWRSKPHKAIVYAPCAFYGLGIAQGRSGMFYGCVIVADRRT